MTQAKEEGGVAVDETERLIASDKVEGTAVYNREGERLGSIAKLMIDKVSGQVTYAVLSFGGLLGIGDRYFPLPWRALTYDTGHGGYVIDIGKERLKGAPSYGSTDGPNPNERALDRDVDVFYGFY